MALVLAPPNATLSLLLLVLELFVTIRLDFMISQYDSGVTSLLAQWYSTRSYSGEADLATM